MSSELMRRFSGLMSEESYREKVVNDQIAKKQPLKVHTQAKTDIKRV